MKKKIVSIIALIMILLVSLATLTGCGNNDNKKDDKNENSSSANEEKDTVSSISDNSIYYVKINGTKFKAGDKLSSISKVDLKQKEKDMETEIPKNRYLMDQAVIDSNEKEICKFIPLNYTDSKIKAKDAGIGGFEVGDYNYDRLSKETLSYDFEIVGGIKLGSSYEDIVKVFGEEDFKYESEASTYTPAYTNYKYSSGYKGFEFTVDDSGKVSKIRWNNYNYDEE